MAAAATDVLDSPISNRTLKSQSQHQKCFYYELVITSASPCSPFTIGKVKYDINLQQLLARQECYHNDAAYARKLERDRWSNNYTSARSREIFDCHFIEYVEICDDIEFKIKILFFTMKAGELLVPSVIKSDNQIITIIRNHIMIDNNITAPIYHNYRIELLCKEIAKGSFLDLRYTGHPACKTPLYNYQRDSIMRAINIEQRITDKQLNIDFSEHKLLFLDELGLVFDYNLCSGDKCFIKMNELPKVPVYGGIIADEVGLGKTIQALNLALSREGIRTLIIVPNHIKDHWLSEMRKHFAENPFDDFVLIATVNEATQMPDDIMKTYQRLIVDELAELYAKGRPENNNLFARLCSNSSFQYRWGITATPFVDDSAMYNIIRFLLANYKIYNSVIGNYTYIQDQFKHLFLKNIKSNVAEEVKLPDIIIHNCGLIFSEHERAILTAMEMDSTAYSVDDRLRIISNAMLEMTNNDKSVITVDELKQLTVMRFQEKIYNAEDNLKEIQLKHSNIQSKIKEIRQLMERDSESSSVAISSDSASVIKFKDYPSLLREYQERQRHLEIEMDIANEILMRRIQVHKSYLEMTQHISEIIHSSAKAPGISPSDSGDDMASSHMDDKMPGETATGDSGLDEMDANAGIDEDIDIDQMCPICYCPFSENIVLFIRCRHYFCQGCFERCHKDRPNTCPMCRSRAEIGEINYIGVDNRVITSTKNSEILRLLNLHPQERFLIFTRFDKFITPLTNFLSINHIAARTFDEYKASSPEVQNDTRVILLSANSNASGTDMTFMHRVIIIEPFESYIYGKEIEKQLIGRLHRINQTFNVDVYRLYIRNTIEEQLYSIC
jgi:SNF2 family DNA or RNA helicase